MRDILCKIFSFFKYLLLIVSFGLVFYGIIVTYGRLEKPLVDAINIFIPFIIVFILFIVDLILRPKHVSKSLLFNFVSVMVFVVIIIVCLRAMFDTNMILFHKYKINYNPAFLSDNLAAVQAMLYMIGCSNILLMICSFLDRKKKKVLENEIL